MGNHGDPGEVDGGRREGMWVTGGGSQESSENNHD